MPFTASHPAAILPLRRMGLPVAALVIGSMVPDLPYYLPLPLSFAQTHSITGVLTVDLLLGLCAFVAWHALLARPLLWAAPPGMQRRIPDAERAGLRPRLTSVGAVVGVSVALVVGSLTHVAWDAFTHSGMWGIRTFPELGTPVLGLAAHRWLHLASSALGLLAIAWVVARWWRRAPQEGRVETANPAVLRLLWWGLGLWVLFAGVEMAVGLLREPSQFLREQVLVLGLKDVLSGLVLAVLVGAVMWHALRLWRPEWLLAATPSRSEGAGAGAAPGRLPADRP